MGGTGITSSDHVYAAHNNPALLSSYKNETLFGLILPSIEVRVTDNKNLYDGMYKLTNSNYIDYFQEELDSINQTVQRVKKIQTDSPLGTVINLEAFDDLYKKTNILAENVNILKDTISSIHGSTDLLLTNLEEVSKKNIDITLNLQSGFSFSNPKFSFALNASTINYFSNILYIDQVDLDKIRNYTLATNQYATLLTEYANSTVDLLDLFVELGLDPNLIDEHTPELIDSLVNIYVANRDMENFNYGGNTTDDDSDGDIEIIENGEFIEIKELLILSSGQSIAINLNELAFSISKRFKYSNYDINVGITSKLQEIKTYDYLYNLMEPIKIDQLSDIETKKTHINFDVGILLQQSNSYAERKIGLVIRNINNHNLVTINNIKAKFSPSAVLGMTYEFFETIKFTSELDIIPNMPILFEEKNQYARFGAELNIWDTLKLRTGYKVDVLNTKEEYISAGVGLSILGVSMDVGASVANKDFKKDSSIAVGLSFSY
jgi:hypothetical protein